MKNDLQIILNTIENDKCLNIDEKESIAKAIKKIDKEIAILEFKLDRTEKVKRTTSILLEETIAELEKKREAVEEQSKLIEEENRRKTIELEEARQLQLAMLPKELPELPNLDIAVYMQTATEVGGDYYDFKVSMDGTLTMVCGDATGHGLKAGTVVTITKSLFNNIEPEENILDSFSKISSVIKDMKFRQLAMCMIMMKIKSNKLLLSSAAMPPVLIYRSSNKEVEELSFEGMPLGAMKNFPYKLKESELEAGDTILVYSDGLPELANQNGKMYSYSRTITEFQSVGEKEPTEIISHLKNSASEWVGANDPDDDVTFVVIKIK